MADIGKLQPPFVLAPLPYPAASLEPALDAKTMEIHHDKHHQTYVDNLNKLIADKKDTKDLQTIITTLTGKEKGIKNNAGGHWNHTFFWTLLSGDKEKTKMPDRLKSEIESTFESVEKFKEAFEKAALAQFGSGWAWLYRDGSGKLAITTTGNQENPLMDVATVKGRPIFTVDVWEHAYYLGYQNKRADYLKAIWNVVNWVQVDAYDKEVTAH
ncbi:MAG: superoxide dismutase [Rhizobacter sp.]|nr:superoxide dismutase [Bacteriovorax sp.]